MKEKVGRNDPCPCGSGKKYKQCCLNKPPLSKKKITVTNLKAQSEQPTESHGIDLMERTFGAGIARTREAFKPVNPEETNSDS